MGPVTSQLSARGGCLGNRRLHGVDPPRPGSSTDERAGTRGGEQYSKSSRGPGRARTPDPPVGRGFVAHRRRGADRSRLLLAAEFRPLYIVHVTTYGAGTTSVSTGSHDSYALVPIALLAAALALASAPGARAPALAACAALAALGVIVLLMALSATCPTPARAASRTGWPCQYNGRGRAVPGDAGRRPAARRPAGPAWCRACSRADRGAGAAGGLARTRRARGRGSAGPRASRHPDKASDNRPDSRNPRLHLIERGLSRCSPRSRVVGSPRVLPAPGASSPVGGLVCAV